MVDVKRIRKIRRSLYRLVTGLMVVWLAIFYSAICEYHGLMLPLGPNHMAQMDADAATMPMALEPQATPVYHAGMEMQITGLSSSTCKTQASDTLLQFGRMALNTVALSFLTIAAPTELPVQLVQQQSSFMLADTSISHQYKVAPLDPPPRTQPL